MKKVLFYLLVVALFSCEATDESLLNAPQDSFSNEKNFVSLDYAKSIASVYNGSYVPAGDELVTRGVEVRGVAQTMTVQNDNGSPVFYIINMEGGGFRVISADNRLEPVLASSEEGELTNDRIGENPGLQMWVDGMIHHVTSVMASDEQQSDVAKALWNDVNPIQPTTTISSSIPDCAYDGQRITEVEYFGPQISSNWYQTGGFNELFPNGGCNSYFNPNGNYPAGCNTIAAGIAMRYKQKPGFNWADMPWTGATTTTARFLEELARIIGSNYSCSGTTATLADVRDALRYYGYNNANVASFSESEAGRQINMYGVVIMRGDKNDGMIGHAWAATGARLLKISQCSQSPYGWQTTVISTDYDQFFIDWGFNDGSNGWYTSSGFKYPYNLSMVVNIY